MKQEIKEGAAPVLGDGGPAFPTENERQTGPSAYHFQGMTLRDYFAAKAMQGAFCALGDPDVRGIGEDLEIARGSYALADAMLAARTPAPSPEPAEAAPAGAEKELIAELVEALRIAVQHIPLPDHTGSIDPEKAKRGICEAQHLSINSCGCSLHGDLRAVYSALTKAQGSR